MLDQQAMAMLRGDCKKVLFGTDVTFQRHDHVFSDRIDRRIGDLCKKLLEVVEDQPGLVA